MGLRQRKRLLRRRKAAAKQTQSRRRTAVVTGATFASVAGLVAGSMTAPSAAKESSPVGPVEMVTDMVRDGDLGTQAQVEWEGSLLFQGGTAVKTGEMKDAALWRATPEDAPARVFDDPPVDENSIRELTAYGDRFFFTARPEGSAHQELWISDGTDGGTEQLTSFDPDDGGGYSHGTDDLAVISGSLIFTRDDVSDPSGGEDIWVSDGTPEGTHRAVDVRDGYFEFQQPTALGDKIVLDMSYYGEDTGLWVTDLTEEGTYALASSDTLLGSGVTSGPVVGDTMFFSSDVGGSTELWRTDGTTAGTRLVADLTPGSDDYLDGAMPSALVPLADGRLVFRAVQPKPALWVTDGTEAGTKRLKGFPKAEGTHDNWEDGAELSGNALFTVTPGKSSAKKSVELWRSDGTKKGTRKLTPFKKGDKGVTGAIQVIDGRAWFPAHTKKHGTELWSTDGTPRGTGRVTDVHPGKKNAAPRNLVAVGDRLWFLATTGKHGQEWWRTTPDTKVQGAKVKAAAKQKQPKKAIKVRLKARSTEHVKLRATGAIVIKGKKKTVPLKVATAVAAGGETKKLVLAVKKKLRAPVLKALRKKQKVVATVEVTYVDLAGNKATRPVRVRLR